MDAHVLRLFESEVERQACFALLAASDLEAGVASHDGDRIWSAVQALLGAAGNVSKLLWPSARSESRGQALRSSLGVADGSPLQPRTFRNHFEHFDERLETWAASSPRKCFVDSCVDLVGRVTGVDPGDFVRNLDTRRSAVTFRGDTYLLRPVVDELAALQQRARLKTTERPGA